MGWRKLPLAFTEYGVVMLATVLKSDTATQVSLAIIEVFVHFKNSVLGNLKIENKFNVIEGQLNEKRKKLDLLYDKTPFSHRPKQGIFFNGQVFDAYVLSSELIASAKK